MEELEPVFLSQQSLSYLNVGEESGAFNCSFEDGLCGWEQATDDNGQWLLEAGSTDTADTGPSVDRYGSTIYPFLSTCFPP